MFFDKTKKLDVNRANLPSELYKFSDLLFFSSWFVLNIIQACFTQIQDDESYYWVYSKFLAWGYFDHPPMTALLIKAGTVLFPGAIGVRLLPAILNVLTVFIAGKLIGKKNSYLFYAICLSLVVLQLTGFWAVPDIPLMFFTALFFLVYQRFIANSTWINTFLLAIVTACLFYSKYHGVLIVFFTFLAYPQILKNYKIYIAGLLVCAFFIPHLWWQYQHDWMTFRFQLYDKKTEPYYIGRTLDYILGQLVVAGPIAGPIILYSSFGYKPKTVLERVLKFNVIGILIFFLLNSFRGNVEVNWTSAAMIPMIVLTHNYLQQHLAWKKWLFRLLPVTLALVFAARIFMIWDVLPAPAIVERFHSWKTWPQKLHEKTGDVPVVFFNSYQRSSMLWYNTGEMAYSLNVYTERWNNYNFWPIEDSLLGKDVYLMNIYNVETFEDSIQARLWKVGFSKMNNFHSFARVLMRPDSSSYNVSPSQPVSMNISADFPSAHMQYLLQHPEVNEDVKIAVFKNYNLLKNIDCPFSLRDLLKKPKQQILFLPGLPSGSYSIEFIINSVRDIYTHNSYKVTLNIK